MLYQSKNDRGAGYPEMLVRLGRAGMEGGGLGESPRVFRLPYGGPYPFPVYACNAGLLIVGTESFG